jgi:hypothetical protein
VQVHTTVARVQLHVHAVGFDQLICSTGSSRMRLEPFSTIRSSVALWANLWSPDRRWKLRVHAPEERLHAGQERVGMAAPDMTNARSSAA